jgi:hypothetical protein
MEKLASIWAGLNEINLIIFENMWRNYCKGRGNSGA